MPKTAFRILLVAAALLLGGAGIYRWVDEQGHVHFSDVPPKGAKPAAAAPARPAEEQASQGRSAPPKPAAAPTGELAVLEMNVMHDLKSPTVAIFRLAVTVSVPGFEKGDRLEALFEDPANPGQMLAGSRPFWDRGPLDKQVLVSPPMDSVQCRGYAVTIRRYAEGSEEPVAVKNTTIISRMDSATVLTGGPPAGERVVHGERVCPE